MQSKMAFLIFLSILLVCSNHRKCHARDTITTSTPLLDNGETLVSAGKKFELGFFSPDGNSSSRYVGIWYYQRKPQTVVWVANRDKPLLDSTGVVAIAEDGKLTILDRNRATYFSTDLESSTSSNRSAKLLDSGNLVLIDSQSGTHLWQSFENPTDTFLPGMLMKDELKLTSWMTPGNPKDGNYTFQQDQENDKLYITRKRGVIYWESGETSKFFDTREMYLIAPLLTNFTKSPEQSFYSNTRLWLNSSGQLQFYSWDNRYGWSMLWSEPQDACNVHNVCGTFGSCSSENGLACKCFPGFEPQFIDKWKAREFSSGCKRKTAPCSKTGEPDTFLDLKSMKIGNPDSQIAPDNETSCRAECLDNCQCQAYSFIRNFNGSRTINARCWIWTSDLKNLQEKNTDEGQSLSIRVAVSDIESTKRDCKPCGATVIPYPLSTGPDCGDPMYYSFYCHDLTGQVDFLTPNGSYEVIGISKEQHKFVIEIDDEIAESCEASAKKIMVLNQSMPFQVTNSCFADPLSVSSVNSTQSPHKIEIGWNPPSEPTCNSSTDCQDWPNSNCNRTGNRGRCICGPTYRWDGSSLNCTSASVVGVSEKPNQEASSTINIRAVVIVALVIAAVLVVCSLGYYFYKRKMLAERTEGTASIHRNTLTNVYDSDKRPTDLLSQDDRKGTNVSFFKLESILAATESFSDANKLGEGGFGPVYRGKFPGEQDIAVKRLSSHSGQGMEEFQNEVVLIAKLQHRNLVRLLGYCVEGDEKILLYEYMPNRSLDGFIFDKKLCMLLDWTKRLDIILGIARGLLYLHQDSRLRIIHRDLKTSNILLDEEMNPKISDFGLARIVEGKQTEANTNRVVGTYGYMSPEYALEGFLSVKSDVFSFGVIVLEIVSGKRNTGFYQSKEALNLLGYAWMLWKEEKALDLLDQALIESCNKSEVLTCINIGLLCVQEDPNDRPTMANVVSVLGSEAATIPSPNQPAYVARKRLPSTSSSSSSKPEAFSHNELTMSMPQGR